MSEGIKSISAGWSHTIFLSYGGRCFITGDNYKGKMGTIASSLVPVELKFTRRVTQIGCGFVYSLFLLDNSDLYFTGHLPGLVRNVRSPILFKRCVKDFSSGYRHFLALIEEDSLLESGGTLIHPIIYSAGEGKNGRLASGKTSSRSKLEEIGYFSSRNIFVNRVFATYSNSYFIADDFDLYACGYGKSGEMMSGEWDNRTNHLRNVLKGTKTIAMGPGVSIHSTTLDEYVQLQEEFLKKHFSETSTHTTGYPVVDEALLAEIRKFEEIVPWANDWGGRLKCLSYFGFQYAKVEVVKVIPGTLLTRDKVQKKMELRVEYFGQIRGGKRHGIGKEYNTETKKLVYLGEFAYGKRHGKGKLFKKDGKIVKKEGNWHEGRYALDEKISELKKRLMEAETRNKIQEMAIVSLTETIDSFKKSNQSLNRNVMQLKKEVHEGRSRNDILSFERSLIGKYFDHYEVIKLIGEGSFSVVVEVRLKNGLQKDRRLVMKIAINQLRMHQRMQIDRQKGIIQREKVRNTGNYIKKLFDSTSSSEFEMENVLTQLEEIEKRAKESEDLLTIGVNTRLISDEYILPEFFHRLPIHPNLLRLHNCFVGHYDKKVLAKHGVQLFEHIHNKSAFFITPFCKGTLLDFLKTPKRPVFDKSEFYEFLYQVVTGLLVMKERFLIHCDIKPNNLFYNETEQGGERVFLIGDFGMCFDSSETSKPEEFGHIFTKNTEYKEGARMYAPPEIVNMKQLKNGDIVKYDKYDVYSLGKTCFKLFSRRGLEYCTAENTLTSEESGNDDDIVSLIASMVADYEDRISLEALRKRIEKMKMKMNDE